MRRYLSIARLKNDFAFFHSLLFQVRACDPNIENCNPFCEDAARKRRENFDENAKFKITSFGPIRYQNNFNFYEC